MAKQTKDNEIEMTNKNIQKEKEEIDFTRFGEVVARQREFMNFVAQKYPEVYKEFCVIENNQEKEFELLRKIMNKEQKFKGASNDK